VLERLDFLFFVEKFLFQLFVLRFSLFGACDRIVGFDTKAVEFLSSGSQESRSERRQNDRTSLILSIAAMVV
jgi:hypothetical protein